MSGEALPAQGEGRAADSHAGPPEGRHAIFATDRLEKMEKHLTDHYFFEELQAKFGTLDAILW